MVTRKTHILGKPLPRREDQHKLTGDCQFVDDLRFAQPPLHVGLVVSAQAHARLLQVDLAAAAALPGVVAILTAADVPGCQGVYVQDRPVLAGEVVRYVGEPIVALAAETPEAAAAAAALVRVVYEPLPPLLDVAAALAADAPPLHPQMADYARAGFVTPQPGSNVAHAVQIARGDLTAGWAEAAVIIEETYTAPQVISLPLEPQGAVAQLGEDGRVHLWSSHRAPFVQRQIITQALGWAPEDLRVRTALAGDGYGDKTLVAIEAIVAALARRTQGRAVKLVLRRGEAAPTAYAQPGLQARLKLVANASGHLTALQAEYLWDGGASADAMIEAAWAAAYMGAGPYAIPHLHIASRCVYTNRPPAAPARAYGMAQLHWAVEQQIDRIAAALGMDAVEVRLRNFVKGGDDLAGGWVMHANGIERCLRLAARAVKWGRSAPAAASPTRRRGRGVAALWTPALAGDPAPATAAVVLDSEGFITLQIGAVDAGQGFHAVAAQLVAAALSVPPEWVRFAPVDTDSSPLHWLPPAGHLVWSLGNALLAAAQEARGQVLAALARLWDEPVGNLDISDGQVISYASERTLCLRHLLTTGVRDAQGRRLTGPFRGEGAFAAQPLQQRGPSDPAAPPVLHFSVGAVAIDIEVDTETGQIFPLHLTPVMDVGHAINPDAVSSQIKSAALAGLGMALFEHMHYSENAAPGVHLADYDMITIRDLPARLEAMIVEVPQEDGPYGMRDMGEHAFIGVPAALALALHDALGLRPTTLPLTSERVWLDSRRSRMHAEVS